MHDPRLAKFGSFGTTDVRSKTSTLVHKAVCRACPFKSMSRYAGDGNQGPADITSRLVAFRNPHWRTELVQTSQTSDDAVESRCYIVATQGV